ncbi:hypothetical protein KC330_g174 [Hortaea werneckii]|nr:hypothetical protein KC330_g174 [Hortaea werneckii]
MSLISSTKASSASFNDISFANLCTNRRKAVIVQSVTPLRLDKSYHDQTLAHVLIFVKAVFVVQWRSYDGRLSSLQSEYPLSAYPSDTGRLIGNDREDIRGVVLYPTSRSNGTPCVPSTFQYRSVSPIILACLGEQKPSILPSSCTTTLRRRHQLRPCTCATSDSKDRKLSDRRCLELCEERSSVNHSEVANESIEVDLFGDDIFRTTLVKKSLSNSFDVNSGYWLLRLHSRKLSPTEQHAELVAILGLGDFIRPQMGQHNLSQKLRAGIVVLHIFWHAQHDPEFLTEV